MRRRDTRLPPQSQSAQRCCLAQQLRGAHPDDMDFARAVLDMFRRAAVLLHPDGRRRSAQDSVDEFLFETRRGFCGHYASAFAALMRAAGIPARVVTGYQGGTFNRYADYWILRQSDAHAWNEIWIEGRGWVRIDPTSAIAPERVERGLNEALAADEPLAGRWQRHSSVARRPAAAPRCAGSAVARAHPALRSEIPGAVCWCGCTSPNRTDKSSSWCSPAD